MSKYFYILDALKVRIIAKLLLAQLKECPLKVSRAWLIFATNASLKCEKCLISKPPYLDKIHFDCFLHTNDKVAMGYRSFVQTKLLRRFCFIQYVVNALKTTFPFWGGNPPERFGGYEQSNIN